MSIDDAESKSVQRADIILRPRPSRPRATAQRWSQRKSGLKSHDKLRMLKRPNTAAVEISGRANHETVRRIRLNDLGLPSDFVRQLAAGEQADSVTNGFFSAA
jgi:hypothetical protein